MSLMRINHVKNELKNLNYIINKLIENYEADFKDYVSEFEKKAAQDQENEAEIFKQKIEFGRDINNLKTFAQFQNELILVKHVALIESMIIQIFRHLVILLGLIDYQKEYFNPESKDKFSDVFVAVNKISDITEKMLNIKKMKFWYLYKIMRDIRHSIAHGEPLFIMQYRKIKDFNEKINIIHPYSEKNEDQSIIKIFPSLLHPTYSNKSKWYCHLSNKINGLPNLNKECCGFVEEINKLYLSYGESKNILEHDLFAQTKKN